MVKQPYIPERGDILWVDFGSTRGHEQRGHRPALALSPGFYNRKSLLVLVCPITSRPKGYTFEVPLALSKIGGVVLVDQVRAIDWRERKVKYLSCVPSSILIEVRAKLRALLET